MWSSIWPQPLSANAGLDRTAGPSWKAGRWAPTCCVKHWFRQGSQAHGFKPPRSAFMATRRALRRANPKAKASSRRSRGVGACIATEVTAPFRLVRMRLGLVLSPDGAPWPSCSDLQIWPWRPLGSGQQHMGWVHLEDVIQFITWAAATRRPPTPTTSWRPGHHQRGILQIVGQGLESTPLAPRSLALPSLAMGEMSSLLLEGQNVRPARLLDAGFQWKHPTCWARCSTAPPDRTSALFTAFWTQKRPLERGLFHGFNRCLTAP